MFLDDQDKMRDFYILTKEEFLASYSYLSSTEYDATAREIIYKTKERAPRVYDEIFIEHIKSIEKEELIKLWKEAGK